MRLAYNLESHFMEEILLARIFHRLSNKFDSVIIFCIKAI